MYRSLIIAGALVSLTVSAADMSGWSDKTVCRLVEQHGKAEYIDEAKSRGLGCANPTIESVVQKPTVRVKSPLTATAYENRDDDFEFPPFPLDLTWDDFWFVNDFAYEDLNDDGVKDYVLFGTPRSAQTYNFIYGGATKHKCHKVPVQCDGAEPMVFLGSDPDVGPNTYKLKENVFIDPRSAKGVFSIGQVETADFNGDGTPDFFAGDTGFYGVQGVNGIRDSYYLSQPDGTWLESSDTHMSHKDFNTFAHAISAGDIDGDGDIDVVVQGKSDGRDPFYCWINQGGGQLKLNRCGSSIRMIKTGSSYELVDIDSDGDLDLIGGPTDDTKNSIQTHVLFNNGKGRFSNPKLLPKADDPHFDSGSVDVRGWDLDKDGDQDLILSLIGQHSNGAAIQILENIDGKGRKWKSHFFPFAKPRNKEEEHTAMSAEGGPMNHDITSIYIKDIDGDGYDDLVPYLSKYSENNHGYHLIARSRLKTVVKDGGLSFKHLLEKESGVRSAYEWQFSK